MLLLLFLVVVVGVVVVVVDVENNKINRYDLSWWLRKLVHNNCTEIMKKTWYQSLCSLERLVYKVCCCKE